MTEREDEGPGNFVEDLVREDIAQGRYARPVTTRFPPEPNGYLHIGHAKSITLNFGLSKLQKGGKCNLRFDDTNPVTEDPEFVESIQADVRWIVGDEATFDVYYASDYFEQLYEWAEQLVKKGLAYVDSRSEEVIRETRGDFHKPGVNSPFRERSVEENLDLLRRMRAGAFDDGAHVLRAKIDMQSPDIKLRDPLMYRIKKAHHYRLGDAWCIYPMYDWAHGQSDAIEGITHSVCSLEFVNHRALYDWFLKALELEQPPRQIEFGKLALTYTVLSKRRLKRLVDEGHVDGWDDPRMPTIAGMRRRGFTPEALRNFCERVGVSKNDGAVDISLLEFELREHLNETSPRVMAVLRPLKLTITNWPEGEIEHFELQNIPNDDAAGTRKVPFGRNLWVDHDDFLEEAPKKWWRLAPGKEVRLRGAALVTVNEVVKNAAGDVVELKCTWDPESRGGSAADGRKVRGTIHWVHADSAIDAEVRLYDRLFAAEDPYEGGDFLAHLNASSRQIVSDCKVEPSLADAVAGTRVQFERTGYFVVDRDSKPGAPVFNRTIALKDSWAKIAKKQGKN